jgi:RecB family exonuclease
MTPSLATDLLDCAYRLAWRMDDVYRVINRPNTYSELGIVAHAVMEDAGNQLFVGINDDNVARGAIEKIWSKHVARASANLAAAWAPATPPVPEDWPGYYLTKSRIIQRALRRRRDRSTSDGHWAPPLIEKTLEDSAARLRGRPDRVEGPKSDRRVVDLKTGLSQTGPNGSQLQQLLLYGHLVEVVEGDHVSEIAVEDSSGRRWKQPFDHVEVSKLLGKIERARSSFEAAQSQKQLSRLASPSKENCRWCPYRVACAPYWASLHSSWQHGSVFGIVDRSQPARDGSILEVTAKSPVDLAGPNWVVSLVPEDLANPGRMIAIAGAEITGTQKHLRWRWSTTVLVI